MTMNFQDDSSSAHTIAKVTRMERRALKVKGSIFQVLFCFLFGDCRFDSGIFGDTYDTVGDGGGGDIGT